MRTLKRGPHTTKNCQKNMRKEKRWGPIQIKKLSEKKNDKRKVTRHYTE